MATASMESKVVVARDRSRFSRVATASMESTIVVARDRSRL
jgi:hypothetical protein